MYADRIASGSKRSVKDRLNGNLEGDFDRIKQINGKRQRQTDSWKHDIYDDDERQLSNPNVGAQDLRLKLQRKGVVQQSGKGGPGDLRAKLSGMMHAQPGNIVMTKAKPVLEVVKPARKNLPVVATPIEIEKVAISVPKTKKSLQKDDTSVGGLLRSLGLEKYLITFQAEEIDTTALMHMIDKDLKTLGIPMVLGDCTYFDCKKLPKILETNLMSSVPIGIPISNSDIVLVGAPNEPNEGEIYVGGLCTSIGYFLDPVSTSLDYVKLSQESGLCNGSQILDNGIQVYFRTTMSNLPCNFEHWNLTWEDKQISYCWTLAIFSH